MKLGVLGSGMIVPQFLNNCLEYNEIILESICSTKRSFDKAKEISEKYEIKKAFDDFEEFLKDDTDTVYIGVPNHLHFEYGKKCLEAGKNVIMEKPFTTTLEDAEELIKIANENNLIIFEAISNQYLPNFLKIKELLNQIGDVKIVQVNYSQYSSRYDAFKKGEIAPVFDKEKGGGALADLGVYNVYFIVGLFGEPKGVQYFPNIDRGVDTSGILIMEYENFKCVGVCAKDCKAPLSVNIQGDKGYINSDSATNTIDSFKFGLNTGDEESYDLNGKKDKLYYEIGAFLEIFNNKDYDYAKQLNVKTLNVMKVLENARKYIK